MPPASPPTQPVFSSSILLLAGGRGQRVGGQDKGLLSWRGQPLIAHLHALCRPLSDDLIISCNRNQARYQQYADHLVGDHEDGFPGPFAGILAGLAVAKHSTLLVLPCDAPLLGVPLLEALHELAALHPNKPIMVRRGEQWEPLFCVVPTALLPALEYAWQAGERSPRRALQTFGTVALECDPDDPRLANLNTLELIAASER